MKRGTWGIAVRLLVVIAAIYAFFSLRSQLDQQRPSSGAIPVHVVSQTCGSIIVQKTASPATSPSIEWTPALKKAVESPGSAIQVRDQTECDTLKNLHGRVFEVNGQLYSIEFK